MSEDNGLVRILLVDDTESLLQLLRVRLSEEFPNAVVDAFSDPVEALRIIKDKKYTLVLSDFNMPELNGDELCRQAKSVRPDINFIISSGNFWNDALAHAAGAEFIAKPYKFGVLTDMIKKYIPAPQGS